MRSDSTIAFRPRGNRMLNRHGNLLLRSISYLTSGGRAILSGVDLSISDGEVLGILGPSGPIRKLTGVWNEDAPLIGTVRNYVTEGSSPGGLGPPQSGTKGQANTKP